MIFGVADTRWALKRLTKATRLNWSFQMISQRLRLLLCEKAHKWSKLDRTGRKVRLVLCKRAQKWSKLDRTERNVRLDRSLLLWREQLIIGSPKHPQDFLCFDISYGAQIGNDNKPSNTNEAWNPYFSQTLLTMPTNSKSYSSIFFFPFWTSVFFFNIFETSSEIFDCFLLDCLRIFVWT